LSPAVTIGLGLAGALGLGGALLAGWSAPGLPPAPSLALTHPRPQPAVYLRRPGGDMRFALDGLRGDLGPDHAPSSGDLERRQVVYRPPLPPPPPPPPDVALVFRREVSAVVRTPGQGLAVLLSQPGQRSRLLRPGDSFDDQWRLTSLTSSEAVLGDGVSQRRVALFGGAAGVAGWGSRPGAPPGPNPDGVN
jgi:hypothetical protein